MLIKLGRWSMKIVRIFVGVVGLFIVGELLLGYFVKFRRRLFCYIDVFECGGKWNYCKICYFGCFWFGF